MALVHATDRLARWRLRLSDLEINVVLRGGTRNQADDAIYSLQVTFAGTEPSTDDFTVALIDTDITESTKVLRENHPQALAQVVEGNYSLKKGAAPTIVELLQHRATDSL